VHSAAANSECPAEPRQPTSLAASVSSQVKFIFPGNFCIYASGGAAGAAPWPNFTKRGNDCPDSRTTCVQNFTPLALSAVEKSVTVQRSKKKHSKLSIPHTTVWWDKKVHFLDHLITQCFTGLMLFLTPNQQCQSTEGEWITLYSRCIIYTVVLACLHARTCRPYGVFRR